MFIIIPINNNKNGMTWAQEICDHKDANELFSKPALKRKSISFSPVAGENKNCRFALPVVCTANTDVLYTTEWIEVNYKGIAVAKTLIGKTRALISTQTVC